ncbi:MAG: hypothetical protein ACOYO1_11970 [Bacteroidales bacterium]
MRPIRINNKIIIKLEKLIDDELANDLSQLSKAKSAILGNFYSSANESYSLFEIRNDFKGFILKTPEEQVELITNWNNLDRNLFYDYDKRGRESKITPFGNNILSKLNYEDFRSTYAYIISKIIGIKACPYCNAILTIVAEREGDEKKSLFQLDHFFPKSKFPLLSISIFNLIPSCANCNHTKSNDDVDLNLDFHLYYEETPLDAFKFKLSEKSIIEYVYSKNREIEIQFLNGEDSTPEYAERHNRSFDIKGIYDNQKDIAEELIWKSLAYNDSRIKELSTLLNIGEEVIKRMVIGNYIDREDIHKRPLAKFQQDIARQLGLIK